MDFSSSDYSFRPSYISSESVSSSFGDNDFDALKTTVVKTYGKRDRVVFGDKLQAANSLQTRKVFNNSNEESPGDPFDRLFRNYSNPSRDRRSTTSTKRKQLPKKTKINPWEFPEENSVENEADGCISPLLKKKFGKRKFKVKEKMEPEVKLDPRYYPNWNDIDNTTLLVEAAKKNNDDKSHYDVDANAARELIVEECLNKKKVTPTIQETRVDYNETAMYGILSSKSSSDQATSTPYAHHANLKPSFRASDINALATFYNENDELDSTITFSRKENQIKECVVVLTRLHHSLEEKNNGPSPKSSNTEHFDNLCQSFGKMSTTPGKKTSNLTSRLQLESDLSDITEENEDVPLAKEKTSIAYGRKSSISIVTHDKTKSFQSNSLRSSVLLKQHLKRSLSPDFLTIFNKSGNIKLPRLAVSTGKDVDVRDDRYHRRTTLLAALTPHDTSIAGNSICGPSNVLLHCGQEKPILFSNFLKNYSSIQKIDEGSYGEVFKATNKKKEEIVLKIQPICEGEDNNFDTSWPEVVCTCRLSELRYDEENMTASFINVNKIACLQGTFPRPLLKMWDDYADTHGSESDRPNYNSRQKYLGYEIENGGINLETFRFSSMAQAVSIFLQIAAALAVAEKAVQFEHRDLHWGNVLVKDTQDSYIAFTLNGDARRIKSHKVKATLIDFGLSRLQEDCAVYTELDKQNIMTGTGDYQFDIYRNMGALIGNNWDGFYPKTNIMWLHYLVDKLRTSKKYSSKSRAHLLAMNQLDIWADAVLNYDSASMFVKSNLHFFN